MAFAKTARAKVVHPQISSKEWTDIRRQSVNNRVANVRENLIDRASEIFEEQFNPEDYLLSHATIVCSVDTYAPSGFKTGSLVENGFRINRRYPKFRVSPETQHLINNNQDCFERSVLLKSFKTFIGAHNFCEHVQVESLSKGRIIDAVARDVGHSVYIDILIATSKKHEALISDIKSGKMGTLSMGCNIEGSTCTKCGNWAPDETALCSHIKYEKGNVFYDDEGRKHIIAEICGAEDLDPTGGVTFIEASWVANPAFKGAVLRNVLEPSEEMKAKMAQVLSTVPKKWDSNKRSKSADWDMGGDPGGMGDATGDPAAGGAPQPPPNPMKEIEDQVEQHLLKKVKDKVKKDITDSNDEPKDNPDTLQSQDSVVKQASPFYVAGIKTLLKTASTDAHFVDALATFNKAAGIDIPVDIYRTALRVGSSTRYSSYMDYTKMCRRVLGRKLTASELKMIHNLSRLLSRRGQ